MGPFTVRHTDGGVAVSGPRVFSRFGGRRIGHLETSQRGYKGLRARPVRTWRAGLRAGEWTDEHPPPFPFSSRAVLMDKRKRGFVTPTERNVHGDALWLMVKAWAWAWAGHKTTETVLNNGWRLAVGGWWRLAGVDGWWSFGAVLDKTETGVLNDSPAPEGGSI